MFSLLIVVDLLYKAFPSLYYLFGLFLALNVLLLIRINGQIVRLHMNMSSVFFAILMGFAFITIPLNSERAFSILLNMGILIAFYFTVYSVGHFTNTAERKEALLKSIFLPVSLCMNMAWLIQGTKIHYLYQLLHFFSTSTRQRYSILGHYNDGGLNAFCCIALSVLLLICLSKRTRHRKLWTGYIILSDVIAFLVILAGSSRNAMISLIIFIAVFLLCNMKRKQSIALLGIGLAVLAVAVISFLQSYYRTDDIWELVRYSGRMIAFNVANDMKDSSKWLYGMGLCNKTDLMAYGNFVVDSSYIFYLVHTGVIGFGIMVLYLIFWVKNILFVPHTDKAYRSAIYALLISYLFTGIFETTVLYAGMPIAVMLCPVLFQYELNGNEVACEIRTKKECS